MPIEGKINKKLYCSHCKCKTNHGYLLKHEITNRDLLKSEKEDVDFQFIDSYYITQCLGCDNIGFFREYGDEDMSDPINGYYTDQYVYPEEPIVNERDRIPKYEKKDFKEAPETIQELYNQVVGCFELRYYLLAAVGLRMIIEGFCLDQSIEDGFKYTKAGNRKTDQNGSIKRFNDLEGRINGMVEKQLITPSDGEILHQIRYLGNATAHELEVPKRGTIMKAIEIIEHLITGVYVFKKIVLYEND